MTVLPGTPPAVALPAQPAGVAWPTTSWPQRSLPASTTKRVDRLLDRAFPRDGDRAAGEEFGQSLAFVAVKGGQLVAERYGPTAGPDVALISWSMAKSVTQALIGILARDGRIDPSAPAAVPEWTTGGDPRAAITVDELLRMVPGLAFAEDYVDAETSDCIEMLFGSGSADMAAFTAAKPLVTEPGEHFNYSSGTTNVLCRLIADQVGSGPDFEAWARAVLFDPIGMSVDLTFDEAGTWVGSSFLNTTARDFAKFGLLYLRDGIWEDRRILPSGWVDEARTVRAVDDDGAKYGSHWWIWPWSDDVFFAAGYETQRIIVDPGSDLVLVRLGKTSSDVAPRVDGWLEELRVTLAG